MGTRNTILEIISSFSGVKASQLTDQTAFEDLRLDSLDRVEIVMCLEDEFEILIEQQGEIKTVGELIGVVEKLI